MNEPTICAQCGGSLERKIITHQQPWGHELYEFENVPALVCRQCGEIWLDAKVTQAMDAIIEQHPEPKRYHQVPVFSLSEFTVSQRAQRAASMRREVFVKKPHRAGIASRRCSLVL